MGKLQKVFDLNRLVASASTEEQAFNSVDELFTHDDIMLIIENNPMYHASMTKELAIRVLIAPYFN